MPTPERPQRNPVRKRSPLAPTNQAQIEKERNRLFDEVMLLRQVKGVSSQALETARILLTKQWIKADWRARERLIKAADWMLQVESIRGTQSPA